MKLDKSSSPLHKSVRDFVADPIVRCGCGAISGLYCDKAIPKSATIRVEFSPRRLISAEIAVHQFTNITAECAKVLGI